MDLTVQLPTDPVERRRMQNRRAQRKFRQKRQERLQAAGQSQDSLPSSEPRPEPASATDLLASSHDEGINSTNLTIGSIEGVPDINSSYFEFADLDINNLPSTPALSSLVAGAAHPELELGSAPPNTAQPSSPVPLCADDEAILAQITSARPGSGWLSPLHIAALRGHARMVAVLLARPGTDVNEPDSDGRTALIHAVVENHADAAQALLLHGARIGAADKEHRSALHWAVLYRRCAILRLLLAHRAAVETGLDINAVDTAGWAPFHMAVYKGFEEAVVLLADVGADTKAKAYKCPWVNGKGPVTDLSWT